MGRALSVFLIVAGFLALIGLAFLPRIVTVTINVEDSSSGIRAGGDVAPQGAPEGASQNSPDE